MATVSEGGSCRPVPFHQSTTLSIPPPAAAPSLQGQTSPSLQQAAPLFLAPCLISLHQTPRAGIGSDWSSSAPPQVPWDSISADPFEFWAKLGKKLRSGGDGGNGQVTPGPTGKPPSRNWSSCQERNIQPSQSPERTRPFRAEDQFKPATWV